MEWIIKNGDFRQNVTVAVQSIILRDSDSFTQKDWDNNSPKQTQYIHTTYNMYYFS